MAPRNRRQRAFFDAFARLLTGRAVRFVACFFALLQIVAPMWHVCEMGGRCHDCKSAALSCHVPNASPTKTAGATEARHCSLCKPQKTGIGLHGAFIEADSRADSFKGTCLARELMSMGRVTVAPLQLIVRPLSQVTPPSAVFSLPDCAAASLPPARAPPNFSL